MSKLLWFLAIGTVSGLVAYKIFKNKQSNSKIVDFSDVEFPEFGKKVNIGDFDPIFNVNDEEPILQLLP